MSAGQPHFMTDRTVLILLFVATLSTMALLVLFAFAPDLRPDITNGSNAASRSAIGYAGLADLLSRTGTPMRVDHGPVPGINAPAASLTILTPDERSTQRAFSELRTSGPILVILPKWSVLPITLNPSWVMKLGMISPNQLLAMTRLRPGSVTRDVPSVKPVQTRINAGAPAGLPEPLYPPIENIQTLFAGKPLLSANAHGPLLVQMRGGRNALFYLAEPDLMNNHGLSDETTARAAVAIIAALRRGNGPVVLDVTLNGLGHTPSFLRVLFDHAFLGATICAVMAAILIGWHGASRFGAPLRGERIFALGTRALADSTANLIRMMGREGAMARRYVVSARDAALAGLGARRATEAQQNALLTAIEAGGAITTSHDALMREAENAASGADLLRIARKAYVWRQEITGGH